MKFKANTRRRAIEYEKALVDYWKTNKTFEKSVEQRPTENSYVFYDGPPFITGVPHHGTLLSSIIKDAVPRYWTMKGKRVERVWGWDSHGLPAENFVEKQLGITDRRDIGTKISLEDYIVTARDSMVANSATWENVIDRVGRWVDFQGAYKTMDKDFMESVWWGFKTLYDKDKIYEGEKVLMYDTKFATPVSKNEVTMDNDAYQTVTDPSVYVKFKLKSGSTLLAWTTTPWTLPANTALAVNPELDYVEVRVNEDQFILAKELIEKVLTDEKRQPLEYEIIRELRGEELVGHEYEPLIPVPNDMALTPVNRWQSGNGTVNISGNNYRVWAANYVTAESGTGIVHTAPSYGEDDFELAKSNNFDMFHTLDDNGIYYESLAKQLYELMPWKDASEPLEVWSSNKDIAKALQKAGIVWKIDYIQHEYPFNPRSKQRIMYRAIPSWFFDIDGSKPLMLEKNENINWFPAHLKHGRFAKNIEQAPDWNLSRDRFWATAMPVWKGIDAEGNEQVKVIGSYAELKELSGVELDDYHRPWVDDIEFDLDGVHYKRIEKVLDGWFESGSMPFAQFHYPFENKDKFEANFPGDFIVEYIGQVRAWFYYVHAVNTALFGSEAFRNVITTGTLAGNDGRKMSKSLGNYTDPNELMDKFSADSLRLLLIGSPLLNGEDFSLLDKDVGDVARKLSMIWNMYDFFTMYAEVDGWEFDGELHDPSENLTNPLDQWIVSRVHQLNEEVAAYMDTYDLPNAVKPILPFIEDASNWYVRRSRRRFWKSDDDSDKNDAYRTLHYVLVQLSMIIAPFTPFLAEELYQKLTGGESVHLLSWPEAGQINQDVLEKMAMIRRYIEDGLRQRAEHGIKIRQPLATATIEVYTDWLSNQGNDHLLGILEEELNIKKGHVVQSKSDSLRNEIVIDWNITPELRREGLSREVIRYTQAARKESGLNVDDRIELSFVADGELQQAIEEYASTIANETLAVELTNDTYEYQTVVRVDDQELRISLRKHSSNQ